MSKSSYGEKVFPSVLADLVRLGEFIRIARKRRKRTMGEVAERLGIGYQTVVRIEKGDPNVGMAAYFSVLWLLDLDKQFVESIHPDHDKTGKDLELSRLPKRVVHKRSLEGGEYDF